MRRKIPLLTDHIYHIFNKSIYGYTIFNSPAEYQHMLEAIGFYRWAAMPTSFSVFQRYHRQGRSFTESFETYKKTFQVTTPQPLVRIIVFCLIPTHIHFQLQQTATNGIQLFMQNIQNSYTQYFNNRHNRRGPLWQSRFGNTLIDDDPGLLRNSLYIHANPVRDLGIPSPEQWPYSSYNAFVDRSDVPLCDHAMFNHIFSPNYANHMAEYLKTAPPPESGAVISFHHKSHPHPASKSKHH